MKIAFIGAGNMGGAMINGIIAGKAAKPSDMYVFDLDAEKTKAMAKKLKVNVCGSEGEAAKAADIIFIAVKPNVTGIVAEKINNALGKDIESKIIVSIAAGVCLKNYLAVFGEKVKIVRAIPNLPAFVRAGLTGLYFYNFDDDNEKDAVVKLFDSFGKTVCVKSEKMIDEMISVTSSSPAYFCLMIDAMADAAVKSGFTRKEALVMAEQAMLGTAQYMLEKDKHPGVLKDEVCSPAGTTIEAVAVLEENGFRNAVIKAMEACEKKAVKKEGYI